MTAATTGNASMYVARLSSWARLLLQQAFWSTAELRLPLMDFGSGSSGTIASWGLVMMQRHANCGGRTCRLRARAPSKGGSPRRLVVLPLSVRMTIRSQSAACCAVGSTSPCHVAARTASGGKWRALPRLLRAPRLAIR